VLRLALRRIDEQLASDKFSEGSVAFLLKLREQHKRELAAIESKKSATPA
jgi:hypothetical protein